MEVWVAGATGVLGRHTIPLLLSAGHSVVGLARDRSKWPDAPPGMRFVPCDITVAGQVTQAFAGATPDAVVNVATALPAERPNHAAWAHNDVVRREGARNLVDAALLADAYFIQMSTHYVAAAQGENFITEDSPFAHAGVIESAIDAERSTMKTVNAGLRACVLRACTVYCADSGQTKALVHAIKTGMPAQLGDGRNFWSFIHPYDVGTAVLKALDKQPPGESYYLGDDEPMRMAHCLQWIAREIHAHPPKSIAPFLAKLAMGGDTVDLLMGSRRVSNAKARLDLDWKPRYPSFREGFIAEFSQS